MIIFLYGPDDYRRAQRKKEIISEFEKKHTGLSLRYFDLEEVGALDNFREFMRGQSLFKEKKMAVLENISEAEEKLLKREIEPFTEDKNATILISAKKKPPKALEFLIKKAFKTEEFDDLSGPAWAQFIDREAKKQGFSFEAGAKELIAEVYKGNTWGLVTEIEKLKNLGKKIIMRRDLDSLGLETLPNYWAVMNGLRGSRVESRLWALEALFAQKEPAAKIFNILASMWREKLPVVAEYDFKIKSGKLEYEEILLDLVL